MAQQEDCIESYSLWVMPSGQHAEQLQAEINKLSEEHNGPPFEPHVTVLPDIQRPREEVVAICEQLASKLKVRPAGRRSTTCAGARPSLHRAAPLRPARRQLDSLGSALARRSPSSAAPPPPRARPRAQKYPLSYLDVAAGAIFHQCVYLRCAKSHEALAAAQQAREAYGMAGLKPYMPHLSLLYSDIDEATRQQVRWAGLAAGQGDGRGWRLARGQPGLKAAVGRAQQLLPGGWRAAAG
jgi:hypothetical protein